MIASLNMRLQPLPKPDSWSQHFEGGGLESLNSRPAQSTMSVQGQLRKNAMRQKNKLTKNKGKQTEGPNSRNEI